MDVWKSREDSSVTVPHPSVLTEWVDDMKQWSDVGYIDIVDYLSKGAHGKELCNHKAHKQTTACTVTK